MPESYISEFTVKETNLDTMGHMNNAEYLKIFEQTRWDWAELNGMGFHKIRDIGIGFVVLSIDIKFAKELHLRDKLTIKTGFIEYRKKLGIIQQTMTIGDTLYCEAQFRVGLMDLKKRQLVRPTPEFIKAFSLESFLN
ncbi:MAG: acyl-CoA thioesterase [Pseudobacteriovorax sp.]|nr:acyl-CoA thioesterase [Pseudobacteriovorax sp.]